MRACVCTECVYILRAHAQPFPFFIDLFMLCQTFQAMKWAKSIAENFCQWFFFVQKTFFIKKVSSRATICAPEVPTYARGRNIFWSIYRYFLWFIECICVSERNHWQFKVYLQYLDIFILVLSPENIAISSTNKMRTEKFFTETWQDMMPLTHTT